jgi:hypothetical protein
VDPTPVQLEALITGTGLGSKSTPLFYVLQSFDRFYELEPEREERPMADLSVRIVYLIEYQSEIVYGVHCYTCWPLVDLWWHHPESELYSRATYEAEFKRLHLST